MSGVLVRLFERAPATSTSVPPARRSESVLLEAILNGAANKTAAGVAISPDSALTYGAVFACVRVLAESIASLPLILYRRLPNGGKERATDHYLYPLLHDAPNPEMSSYDWREAQMINMALWGNCYTQVVHDRAGRVMELWPMLSRNMDIKRDRAGKLLYKSTEAGLRKPEIPVAEMLHVRSMSANGIMGLSPVAMARQAIGLGLATELYGAGFFGNGANPGIVLEHPGKLSDEAYANLQGSWNERSGVENAHKPAILEEGMKIERIGVPPDDAQFLETRQFQVTEIARWYRIPPHMIGDLSKATFSNIEHQALEFVVHTLRPWLVRWEQAILRTLLTPAERTVLFPEFLVDGMLRGDINSRYSAYAIARQWGWLNVDDIRSMENVNPVPGGDVYMAPMNMVPLEQFGQAQASEPATVVSPVAEADEEDSGSGSGNGDVDVRAALGYIYRDAITRITRRAGRDLATAWRKYLARGDLSGFDCYLDQWAQEMRAFGVAVLSPISQAHHDLANLRTRNPGKVTEWVASWLRTELEWIRELVDGQRTNDVGVGMDPVMTLDVQLTRYEDQQRIGEWAQDVALHIADEGD